MNLNSKIRKRINIGTQKQSKYMPIGHKRLLWYGVLFVNLINILLMLVVGWKIYDSPRLESSLLTKMEDQNIFIQGMEIEPELLINEPARIASISINEYFEKRRLLYLNLQDENALIELANDSELVSVRKGDFGNNGLLFSGIIVSLFMMLSGSIVIIKRPEEKVAWSLFFLFQVLTLGLIITVGNLCYGVAVSPFLSRQVFILNGLVSFVTPLMLSFLLKFPRIQFPNIQKWLLPFLYALSTIFFIGAWVNYEITKFVEGFIALGLIFSLLLLIKMPFVAKAQVQKVQAITVLWAFFVPVIVILLSYSVRLFGVYASDSIAVLSSITIPIGLGIAFLRYHLLEIHLVIRRSVFGIGAIVIFLALYYSLISVFAWRNYDIPIAPLGAVITIFLMLVLFQPIQEVVVAWLEQVFYQKRFHYQEVILGIGGILVEAERKDEAVQNVVDTICTAMEVKHMLLAMDPKDEDSCEWWKFGEVIIPPMDIWEELENLQDPILEDSQAVSYSPLQKWMKAAGMALILPLRVSKNHFIGVIALSPPEERGLFHNSDIILLKDHACPALSLYLSRAAAYEAAIRRNISFEKMFLDRSNELEEVRIQYYQHEKMASVGMLAAGVAHELNTPLGVVVSSSQYLYKMLDEEDFQKLNIVATKRLINLCMTAANRAASIVQNLSDFSRPGQGNPEWVDIRDLVKSTLLILEPTIRNTDIEVVKDLGVIPMVKCYPALINQVISNLVLNAIQAMKNEGRIIIRTEEGREKGVRLIVEDTGPGVVASNRTRIFEPFFTTKPLGGGTGLGLSLSFNIIVNTHGGSIFVDDDYNDGARFVVELNEKAPEKELTT